MKTIKNYRKNQYGQEREFVAPENADDADRIMRLTGQKTIRPEVRQWITALAGGAIQFEEIIAP